MKTNIVKAFLLVFMLTAGTAFATTGDVLFQCTFDGPGSTPSEVVTNCGGTTWYMDNSSTIVNEGHDGKKALQYFYPNAGYEIVDVFQTPQLNKQEVTVEYWEKFDVDPSLSKIWNVKSIRAYTGPNAADFMGGMMSLHNNGAWQQGNFGEGTLTTTSSVTSVLTGPGYCPGSGNNYTCPDGRLELSWTPGFGTVWHKVRVYMKAPSSVSAADGITKVWIDDKLIYTLSNITGTSSWVPYITVITFHPSDDFFQISGRTDKYAFHHFYDDITVYEGYVPPNSNISAISPPTGLRIIN